ncbi:signal peptide peptidase A [Methanolobus psychrophilus R15]|nr:signal peptide peptidase A [Methanolobus psychrophilus R15]
MSEKDPDGIDSSSDDVEYHTYPYSYEDTKEEDGNQQKASVSHVDSSIEDATIVAEPQIQAGSGQMDNSGRYEEKKVFSEDLYTGQAPPVKKKSRKWQYIAIVGVLLLIIGSSFALMHQALSGELYTSNDKVAVIYVQGTLLTSSIPGGLGYATSEDISANIRKATNDKAVKAIVLRINSPGGSSTAGEEIYTEVKRASESGIPVVVSMGDVAASAAYHLSAPADLIIANPSTMTGSIGTIWTFQNSSGYYDQEGVEIYVAKSGEFKDMGGSWRGLSDDEKEYANEVVLEVYGHFIQDVADSRRMSLEDVKDLADGRIYTGQKAKELGLVDELGNLYYAINRASELGGIQGEPVVVYMNKPTLSSLLFGSESDTSAVDQFLRYYDESPYGQIT